MKILLRLLVFALLLSSAQAADLPTYSGAVSLSQFIPWVNNVNRQLNTNSPGGITKPAAGGTGTGTIFSNNAVPFITNNGVFFQDPTNFNYFVGAQILSVPIVVTQNKSHTPNPGGIVGVKDNSTGATILQVGDTALANDSTILQSAAGGLFLADHTGALLGAISEATGGAGIGVLPTTGLILNLKSRTGTAASLGLQNPDFVVGTTGTAFDLYMTAASGNTSGRLQLFSAGVGAAYLSFLGGNLGINTVTPSTLLDIEHLSVATSVHELTINKTEAINVDTEGAQNAPLHVAVVSNNTSTNSIIAQSNASLFESIQNGTGDVTAVYASATYSGGGCVSGRCYGAFGAFLTANATVANASAFSLGLGLANETGTHYTWLGLLSGGPTTVGIDLPAGGHYRSAVGLSLRASGPGPVPWDVGLGFQGGSILTSDIQSESSAINILYAHAGAHTNGVILTGATFSGFAFASPGFNVNGGGDINAANINVGNPGGIFVGGVAGVSCSGAPSGSFASVLGIVTHC